MTYQELITEVTTRLHDTGADVVARVKNYINYAYQDIWSRKHWSFSLRSGTLSTTAGTMDYGLSDEVEQIVDMRDADGEARLGELSWPDFDDVIPNPTQQSTPNYYIPNGVLGVRDQLGVTASTVGVISTSTADTSSQQVLIYGLLAGAQQVVALTCNGTTAQGNSATFTRIDRIVKATTSVGVIRVFANTASAGIACTFATIKPDALATEYFHVSVYPMGAATLSYRYKKRAFDMVQTSDVPEIPGIRHEALVYGALVRGGEYMNSSQLPQWQAKYEQMIELMKLKDNPTVDNSDMRVRSDRESGGVVMAHWSRTAT